MPRFAGAAAAFAGKVAARPSQASESPNDFAAEVPQSAGGENRLAVAGASAPGIPRELSDDVLRSTSDARRFGAEVASPPTSSGAGAVNTRLSLADPCPFRYRCRGRPGS